MRFGGSGKFKIAISISWRSNASTTCSRTSAITLRDLLDLAPGLALAAEVRGLADVPRVCGEQLLLLQLPDEVHAAIDRLVPLRRGRDQLQ
jgi:hypothetical protein